MTLVTRTKSITFKDFQESFILIFKKYKLKLNKKKKNYRD